MTDELMASLNAAENKVDHRCLKICLHQHLNLYFKVNFTLFQLQFHDFPARAFQLIPELREPENPDARARTACCSPCSVLIGANFQTRTPSDSSVTHSQY